jgi:hypothetical protein
MSLSDDLLNVGALGSGFRLMQAIPNKKAGEE